jgi:two-component system, OmpR family, aerobic respiration control sensor histidine kinase ArcB
MRDYQYKVLLVEDIKVALIFATHILTALGCEVDTAETGMQAIEQVNKNFYDLIFMDLGLPDTDGLAVTQLIREKKDEKSHIPIIALTAHDTEEDKEKCLKAQMEDFIAKPLTPEKAKYVLEKYVHK